MDAVTQTIITAGEALAAKVKNAFWKNEVWLPKLAFQVGYKMRDLKKIARPMFPELEEVPFLHRLAAFSEQDIRDAFMDFQKAA